MTDSQTTEAPPLAAPTGSDDWCAGYALGHREGYERGMAAATPLPTDIIAVRVPCPLPFMISIMKTVGHKYPKARMRQVGEWTHFTVDGDLDLGMPASLKTMPGNGTMADAYKAEYERTVARVQKENQNEKSDAR